jgi:hypothetical protein
LIARSRHRLEPRSPPCSNAAAPVSASLAASGNRFRANTGLASQTGGVHLCKQNRRQGLDFPLQPPEAAIDPSEDAASIGGALLLRASLATDGQAVTVLFDAIVALLTGKERRHWHWRRRSDGTGMAGLERAGVGVMRHGGVGQDAARSDALRDHAHHRHAQSRRDRASNQAWRATPLS